MFNGIILGELREYYMKIEYFKNLKEFQNFLAKNYQSDEGIWIKLDKRKTADKLTPNQALEEALCYGWIDGQIKSLNDDFYLKYFCKRRPKSIWSERNKKIVSILIKENRIQPPGLAEVNRAKKDERWNKHDESPNDFSLDEFIKNLDNYPEAKKNYLRMSPSIQKTYAMSYYCLKKEESRQKRLLIIIDRLNNNLKPM